jgi:hypothetical protein
METASGPPEHEKMCIDVLLLRHTGMHYVTRKSHGCTIMHYLTHISHCMQKHKFGVTCPTALFMETALGPPEQEKWYVNISRRRCTTLPTDAKTQVRHNVDVLYATPQAHGIVNVALHWEYSLGIVFIFSQRRKYLYHV